LPFEPLHRAIYLQERLLNGIFGVRPAAYQMKRNTLQAPGMKLIQPLIGAPVPSLAGLHELCIGRIF